MAARPLIAESVEPADSLPLFSYAFQPIVSTRQRTIYAYEALVRGPAGEGAGSVLAGLDSERLNVLDRVGRPLALAQAARLGLPCLLNLNCQPHSLADQPQDMAPTLAAARAHGIALERLVFEATEDQAIRDHDAFAETVNGYRALGIKIAIDDFGAGYSGLNLLAHFQPDIVKLDMDLVRGIASHGPRQAIVNAIVNVCFDLGIEVIAEGIEALEEYRWLSGVGVELFQGYLFGRPGFEALPGASFPEDAAAP